MKIFHTQKILTGIVAIIFTLGILGVVLAWTETKGKIWPKNNAPPLREEGEVAHAAQAFRAWKHGD
jgi:succinate dehydrogenase hydrophobic anchor subunit